MYLRISELVADERSAPAMSDFRKDYDGNWWFHVTGKGNKDRRVTVSDAMRDALKRYRKARGLTPALPEPNDATPLVPKQLGRGPVTSSPTVRRIVQDCFDRGFARMKEDGVTEVKAATVHWLRHTGSRKTLAPDRENTSGMTPATVAWPLLTVISRAIVAKGTTQASKNE